ncbi:MAG: TIGR00297 family protein [Halodesulfurarchaeum sp.]
MAAGDGTSFGILKFGPSKAATYVTRPLRRAAALASLSLLSLTAALHPWIAAGAYGLVAVGGVFITGGPAFQLLSTYADRQQGRLRTLVSLSLMGAALSSLIGTLGLPVSVFVATMLTLGFGDLGRRLLLETRPDRIWGVSGFVLFGTIAAFLGQLGVVASRDVLRPALVPEALFLAASAALLGALLRSVMLDRNDPLVLAMVSLLLWLFADVAVAVGSQQIVVALILTALLGYISYVLETASIPGMLTGVFLSLLAVVLGGYGWFLVLLAFFGVGGLATKFRYEEKLERGVAEPNEGARGTGNVLGNSLAALIALILFAAHPRTPLPGETFLFAFAGSVATALGDTLSSEIGGLFDRPRLITSLSPVEAGTDGAVTWQGEIAGVAGAGVIALLSELFFGLGAVGIAVVVLGGVAGMTADSLAGATVEGALIGNQHVNIIATTVGAVTGGALYLVFLA